MRNTVPQTQRRSPALGIPPTALRGLLALAVAALFGLAGCDVGDPVAPYDVAASWTRLDYDYHYSGADSSVSIRIDGEGAIRVVDTSADTFDGLLGPAMWRRLESALTAASSDLLVDPGPVPAVGGAVRVTRDGRLVGFSWTDATDLTAAQRAIVALCDQVRAETKEPPPHRRELIYGQQLLHGCDARGEAGHVVVRDEDRLIELLRRRLDRESVVMPRVDFEREMVLAVFLGPDDPREVHITTIMTRAYEGYLQVPVRRVPPSDGCSAGEGADRGAFDLVRLPRIDENIFLLWDDT